jgi:zinc/manganese transport system substrate-binding protein
VVLTLLCALQVAGCSKSATRGTVGAGNCAAEVINVVVTIRAWEDVVRTIGGPCTRVSTVLSSATADPHDYEPSSADLATFETARLVLLNGRGYDSWAQHAIDAASAKPAVIRAADSGTTVADDNPHLWYAPDTVAGVADRVRDELSRLSPAAAGTFTVGRAAWERAGAEYRAAFAELHALTGPPAVAATEPLAAPLIQAAGLSDRTPRGYARAALNESDPTAADLAAFETVLSQREVAVLIINSQTHNAASDRLRGRAETAQVKIVEMSEAPPENTGFFTWQTAQLQTLRAALT